MAGGAAGKVTDTVEAAGGRNKGKGGKATLLFTMGNACKY